MTDTIRKRAERQRRREAGYKRVECWLSAGVIDRLDSHCAETGQDRSEAIALLISDYGVWK